MKRKLIALLTLCVVLCASIFGLTACNEKPNTTAHSHVYNKKVTMETYLASNATCSQKANYYFSCECGEVGTTTFEHGEELEHNYSDWMPLSGFEMHYRTCHNKCGFYEEQICYGGTAICEQRAICEKCFQECGEIAVHDYSIWKSNGDGTHNIICVKDETHFYTRDCEGLEICGEKPICTYCDEEFGNVVECNYGAWQSVGNGTHVKSCSRDSAHTVIENCSGGIATCTEKATCVNCKEKYGDFEKHVYTKQKIEDKYLKKKNGCETKAQYYYSCECGEKGVDYFEYGDVLEHNYGAWESNGNNTHTRICINDSTHRETKDCSGGTATCTVLAKCSLCGGDYGDLEEHTYLDSYTISDTHHWFSTICGCDVKKDYAKHVLDENQYCNICNRQIGTTDGVLYELKDDDTAEVTGYTGTATEVIIASIYEGKTVTSIGHSAFKRSTIKSIKIPNSITIIDDYAFQYCKALASIEIPNSVTHIGENAFETCDKLKDILLPDSLTKIGVAAFSYTYFFNNHNNWEKNSYMAEYLYIGRYLVDSRNNPHKPHGECKVKDGTLLIADKALSGIGITKAILPNSVTHIGERAFSFSTLTSIEIPDSVTCISNSLFSCCESLKDVKIGNNVTSIGEYAFEGCISLTSIEIPDSVTSIDDNAFHACSSLRSIEIGNNVSYIGCYAFYNCDSLTSVTISNSVTSIGKGAFDYCGLRNVTFEDETTWFRVSNESDWENKTGGTYVDVTNTANNAKYFGYNYYGYYNWYKI